MSLQTESREISPSTRGHEVSLTTRLVDTIALGFYDVASLIDRAPVKPALRVLSRVSLLTLAFSGVEKAATPVLEQLTPSKAHVLTLSQEETNRSLNISDLILGVSRAEAADPQCRVGVRIESYQYFDMAQIVPELGKRHILDWGVDPRAGAAAGFVVDAAPLSYKAGDRDKPSYQPLGSDNIVTDLQNDVGRGTIAFTTTCNDRADTAAGENRLAVRFKLVSSLHPENDQFEVVVPNGVRKVVTFGSEVRKPQDFKAIVDSGLKQIKDMDDKKKELINKATQGNPTPPPKNPIDKEKLKEKLSSIPDEGKREEVRKNIEERGNPLDDPYRYETQFLGGLMRLFNWKW